MSEQLRELKITRIDNVEAVGPTIAITFGFI